MSTVARTAVAEASDEQGGEGNAEQDDGGEALIMVEGLPHLDRENGDGEAAVQGHDEAAAVRLRGDMRRNG
jgi:hypothetical protein